MVVLSTGPPLVIMKIWVKTWNEPMMPITSRNSVVGRSIGMVM